LRYDLTGFPEEFFDQRSLTSYRKDVQRLRRIRREDHSFTVGSRARKFDIEKWVPGVNVIVTTSLDRSIPDEPIPPDSVRLVLSVHGRPQRREQLTPFMMLHEWGEALLDTDEDFEGLQPNAFMWRHPLRVQGVDIHVPFDWEGEPGGHETLFPLLPKLHHLYPFRNWRSRENDFRRARMGRHYLTQARSDVLSDLFALWLINRNLRPDQVIFFPEMKEHLKDFGSDDRVHEQREDFHYHWDEAYYGERWVENGEVKYRKVAHLSKADVLNLYNDLFSKWLAYSLGKTFLVIV